MTAVIGKNGVGKSALFDAFGFLADCLKFGVEEACDARGRGGFDRIRSQGSDEPIRFEIRYRSDKVSRPVLYFLEITSDQLDRPFVLEETLLEASDSPDSPELRVFLTLTKGAGFAWKRFSTSDSIDKSNYDGIEIKNFIDSMKRIGEGGNDSEVEFIEFEEKRKLAIATLGTLIQHPRIISFRHFIEGWYLSYFSPESARAVSLSGPQKHLSTHGENLGNVVQFMQRDWPNIFESILQNIAGKIPGIDQIDTEISADGRLLLRFNDRGFSDPFYAQQMSDGTLKLFAYLIMLGHPDPPPFICIEEPENGLYPTLLEVLAQEFRDHAMREENASQVFVTTHQPYFVDGLLPEEVWILEKGEDGFSTIRRASDDPVVRSMADEGLPLGSLWYSDYLDPR